MRLRYPKLAPEGYEALVNVGRYLDTRTALDRVLLELVYLRASQLNGCEFCIGMHADELNKRQEPDSRIDAVADWRGSDAFSPRERAALAWTEAVTDANASRVSDDDYAAVKEFFEDKDLVDLTYAIAMINAWNRLDVAFRAKWKEPKRTSDPASDPASDPTSDPDAAPNARKLASKAAAAE